MTHLIPSPWHEQFEALLGGARTCLLLCSPYVGDGPCKAIQGRASTWPADFHLLLLTDLSRDNMLSGATDVAAILSLAAAFSGAEIRFLPSLHAKVYVADESEAIVTSANLTDSGLGRNLEYGVRLADAASVKAIRSDVMAYAALASPISREQLSLFSHITEELRDMRKEAEKGLKSRLRREFQRRLRQADDEILRARAAGRAPHAIFAEAIRHILASGPATTVDLHRAIQRIHPDLCDDTIDRVIDGKRFGRKWKHAVRTAQQHLKKRGEIRLVGNVWRLG